MDISEKLKDLTLSKENVAYGAGGRGGGGGVGEDVRKLEKSDFKLSSPTGQPSKRKYDTRHIVSGYETFVLTTDQSDN